MSSSSRRNFNFNFNSIVVILVLYINATHGELRPLINNIPCNMIYKCPNVEDVVWATDDVSCFVLRNSCYLGLTNCLREMRREEALRVIRQQHCQELCEDFCSQDYRPVCGEYNGLQRSFTNECNLYSHICKTGQTFLLRAEGACPNDGKETFYRP